MDKIKQYLKQLGASEELTGSIIKALNEYVETKSTKIEEEYKTRIAKAKQVCVEAVEDYKREISKKVQIFFESKVDHIESQISKQVAVKESAAESKLNRIASLVEGIEVNGVAEAELKALREENLKLKKDRVTVTEDRELAVEKANRTTAIAEKALKRVRLLEQQLTESKAQKSVVTPAKTVSESKTEVVKVEKVGKKSESPKTTNKVLAETVKPTKPKAVAAPTVVTAWDPSAIASKID
jgi:hypothetical protein